jgi:hypothetical protein
MLTLLSHALQDLHAASKPVPHSSGTGNSGEGSNLTAATSLPAPSATAVADAAAVSQLCQEVLLEVRAWQQRMPAAVQLLHSAMQRRHVLMLLALKAAAEGGSMHTPQDDCAGGAHDGARPGLLAGSDAAASAVQVQEALLHYDLIRRDGYEAVFLRNSAANTGNSGDAAEAECQAAHGGKQASRMAAAVGRECAGAHNSLAALLVWVSRNSSTGFLLRRVVEIAGRERQLSEQVGVLAICRSAML